MDFKVENISRKVSTNYNLLELKAISEKSVCLVSDNIDSPLSSASASASSWLHSDRFKRQQIPVLEI